MSGSGADFLLSFFYCEKFKVCHSVSIEFVKNIVVTHWVSQRIRESL